MNPNQRYRLVALSGIGWTAMVFAMSLFTSVHAQDWAGWRGPHQNGVSDETNLVTNWSFEDRDNVLWTADVGGRATPIVLNGRVYLNCRTHHDITDPEELIYAGEQVICWDAATGDELWRDVFNVFQTDIPAPRVGWAAMCGDEETGYVYVHSVSGIFRCYSPDGEVVWEYSLTEEFGRISGYGGRTNTPVIDEDKVILSFLSANWGDSKGPGPAHTYYAFDKKTGDVIWVSAPGGRPDDTTYSTPVVTEIDGQRLLIGGNADGGVYAMQVRTGKKVWGFQMSQRGLNSSPVVDGNRVYIAHGEDNIDTTEFGRVQCIDGSLSGDITETGSLWRVDGIKAGYTGLLLQDGIVYVVSDTGQLYAFDGETGDQLWVQSIGTVGKGSPVWADGKIYVMEVNGNIWTLKPSREGCEVLNHVELRAADVSLGMDEIYASPAISNGRIYFVTRDRIICVGDKDADAARPPSATADNAPASGNENGGGPVATVLAVPYEVAVNAGEVVDYEYRGYDANGNFVGLQTPDSVTVDDSLQPLTVDDQAFTAPSVDESIAGNIVARFGDIEAKSRVRVFSDKDVWKWDFNGYQPMQVPPTWVRAFAKLKPTEVGEDGNMALESGAMDEVRGRPSHNVYFALGSMTDYTIQADVMFREQNRRLSSMGITNGRYTLVIKGNNNKLELQSWQAHLRLGARQSFRVDPETWYTMKLTVSFEGDKGIIKGKVWVRDEDEPADWTIVAEDPRPNRSGSPGLYMYALADSYFDNVIVTRN